MSKELAVYSVYVLTLKSLRAEPFIENHGLAVPCQHCPFHSSTALSIGLFDASHEESISNSSSPTVFTDENVFQVQGRPCEERRVGVEVQRIANQLPFDFSDEDVGQFSVEYVLDEPTLGL